MPDPKTMSKNPPPDFFWLLAFDSTAPPPSVAVSSCPSDWYAAIGAMVVPKRTARARTDFLIFVFIWLFFLGFDFGLRGFADYIADIFASRRNVSAREDWWSLSNTSAALRSASVRSRRQAWSRYIMTTLR